MKMPAIMFSCAIEELEESVDNKRPISSLMKQKWIDDAGGFVGDCETLLRLFRSESTDAWERKIAAYYLAVYEEEQRMMRRGLVAAGLSVQRRTQPQARHTSAAIVHDFRTIPGMACTRSSCITASAQPLT